MKCIQTFNKRLGAFMLMSRYMSFSTFDALNTIYLNFVIAHERNDYALLNTSSFSFNGRNFLIVIYLRYVF